MDKEKGLAGQETEKEALEETSDAADFMKIRLSKTYRFEGEEISELDMGRMENMTGGDMLEIGRMMRRRGNTDASPEVTMEFAFYAAMKATGHPLEFFEALNMKDSMKVKSRVNYFLLY